MRAAALDRFSAGLVGWIPDLSRVPIQRQVTVGVLISALVHLLIFVLLILGSMVFPEARQTPAPPQVTPTPLTLVLAPPEPAKAPIPTFEERAPIIDPRGMEASKTKPKDPKFESDQDMVAGSSKAATGDVPLPSQDGRTDRPVNDFANQQVQLSVLPPRETTPEDQKGKPEEATAATLAAQQPDAAANQAASPPPMYVPNPVAKDVLAANQQAAPNQALPDPARMARATPPPLPKVEKPAENQLAMATPTDSLKPAPYSAYRDPATSPLTQPAPNQAQAPKATPSPDSMRLPTAANTRLPSIPKASDTFRELQQKTKVDGSISNRGPAAVDAVSTPAGRWWMLTKRAIGQNWYLFTDQRRDSVTPGSVRISFTIDNTGKLQEVKVDSSTGSQVLVDVCLQAIKRTPIPAPPADLMENERRIENTITFNYY